MNYDEEKKYKEALEKAKIWQEHLNEIGNRDYADELNYIFPELAESEDERIRKGLVKAFGTIGKKAWGGLIVRDILAWLEKQGKKDPCVGCTNDKGCVTCENGNLKEIEVESKFHEGDFIKHNKAKIICKVISVNSGSYYVENIETGGRIELFNAEQNFHLWSINDAKDGDVVVANDGSICIFKEINPYPHISFESHCELYENKLTISFEDFYTRGCHPATKEQRELLFQKIKEAGYVWDSEKKELKRMEVASKENEDEKIRKSIIAILNNYVDNSNTFKSEMLAWLEKQGEQNPYGQRKECFNCQFNYTGECKGSCQMKIDEQKPAIIIPKFRIGDEIKTSNEESLTITKINEKGYWSEDLFICSFEDSAKWELVEKLVDNVEPKFEVGKWFVNNRRKDVFLIKSINGIYCTLEDTKGNIISPCLPPRESDSHLWTINDAKDGDVLATKNSVFIFKYMDKSGLSLCKSYCEVIGNSELGVGFDFSINGVYPATKEQRDFLFQKMKDAGYQWDSDKKELKRMEVTSKESEDEQLKQKGEKD